MKESKNRMETQAEAMACVSIFFIPPLSHPTVLFYIIGFRSLMNELNRR
jgi:hypothetical protein